MIRVTIGQIEEEQKDFFYRLHCPKHNLKKQSTLQDATTLKLVALQIKKLRAFFQTLGRI